MNFQKYRVVILAVVLLGIMTVYMFNLMQIQIVNGEYYLNQIKRGSAVSQKISAARGEIFDRNGEPMVINTVGFDIIFQYAFLPKKEQNEIILKLTQMLTRAGEEWQDNLPITETVPFKFKEGYEDDIKRLKKNVGEIGVNDFASVDEVLFWMIDDYDLQKYSLTDMRTIAGVRYEMESRGFGHTVPYTFAKNVSIDTVSKVKERSYEFIGVDIEESAIREYVSGNIAPHIIGQIGPIYQEEYAQLKKKNYAMNDVVGKSGIEKAFEDQLRGQDGERQITFDNKGKVIEMVESKTPIPGNSVFLTIDKNFQIFTQEALENTIKMLNNTAKENEGKEANAGSIAVIDIKTSEILALATYPSYNLEDYKKNYSSLATNSENPLINRSLQGTYAPGSTFKPAMTVAALLTGTITESTRVDCQRVYSFYAPSYQPTCMGYHGPTNLFDALKVSCNIFYYDTGRIMGIDNINKYASALGLGVSTGIEVPERIGVLSSPKSKAASPYQTDKTWFPGDVLQASVGQLVTEVTPLQLANYTATIANRGVRNDVDIIKDIKTYNLDKIIKDYPTTMMTKIDSDAKVFEDVIQGMVSASRFGTGAPGFGNYAMDVASKTGTPETGTLLNATFIAFAPIENPQIAISIVIEKGGTGYALSPLAAQIMDYYFYDKVAQLNYLGRTQNISSKSNVVTDIDEVTSEPKD